MSERVPCFCKQFAGAHCRRFVSSSLATHRRYDNAYACIVAWLCFVDVRAMIRPIRGTVCIICRCMRASEQSCLVALMGHARRGDMMCVPAPRDGDSNRTAGLYSWIFRFRTENNIQTGSFHGSFRHIY